MTISSDFDLGVLLHHNAYQVLHCLWLNLNSYLDQALNNISILKIHFLCLHWRKCVVGNDNNGTVFIPNGTWTSR